jgi:hypothetical protein
MKDAAVAQIGKKKVLKYQHSQLPRNARTGTPTGTTLLNQHSHGLRKLAQQLTLIHMMTLAQPSFANTMMEVSIALTTKSLSAHKKRSDKLNS